MVLLLPLLWEVCFMCMLLLCANSVCVYICIDDKNILKHPHSLHFHVWRYSEEFISVTDMKSKIYILDIFIVILMGLWMQLKNSIFIQTM